MEDDDLDFVDQSDPSIIERDKYRRDREFAWEERVMRNLLKQFNLDGHKTYLVNLHREKTGIPRLTFTSFLEEFPTFPIFLVARRVYYAHMVSVVDLEKHITETPIYQAFDDVKQSLHESDYSNNFGVVYSQPHASTHIMHNFDAGDWPNRSYRIEVGKQILFIEPFISFLNHRVASVWSPDSI